MKKLAHSSERDDKSTRKKPIIGYYGTWVTLTYLSIVSAVLGMFLALQGYIGFAVICLMICGLCDMFDGPVARMRDRTKDQESYGIQVDALADIISFGVFPVVLGYSAGIYQIFPGLPNLGIITSMAVAALYILAALIRLAYFNVIEIKLHDNGERRTHYEGMPVTFVAILIPLIYAICVVYDIALAGVYNVMLVIIAAAFLVKVKVPKVRGRYLIIFLLIGLPIVIYLIWNIGVRI
ncbi:MAG: CDP-alcohol phosphatidyltransferase family protein [Oscillospiraceae bacterium]|nr:CDP-alcohol phosphatidyltransferase family protein [Oscillospiraceae bacterium]